MTAVDVPKFDVSLLEAMLVLVKRKGIDAVAVPAYREYSYIGPPSRSNASPQRTACGASAGPSCRRRSRASCHLERELADTGGDNPWWYADRLTPILRALASIYSDRDGWQEEWSA